MLAFPLEFMGPEFKVLLCLYMPLVNQSMSVNWANMKGKVHAS